MKALNNALDKLIHGFESFAEDLRDIRDDLPGEVNDAGYGEEPEPEYRPNAGFQQAPARDNIDDDTVITMKSGDLRQVIDAYRRLVRFAREGRIPTQEQRFKGHVAVKKVKHLVRKPIH